MVSGSTLAEDDGQFIKIDLLTESLLITFETTLDAVAISMRL